MQTECWVVHVEVPAGFANVVRMVKCSITLKENLRESERELQKTQQELKVASDAILEAQHLAFT